MKLSLSIMTHPSRVQYLPYLFQKLGNVPVSMDTGFGMWENCKRAWMMHHPNAEYHCVIQDDVLIGTDFKKRAAAILKKDLLYNFYIGNRPKYIEALDEAHNDGKQFLILNRIYHECCICLPVKHIRPMLKYCDAKKPGSLRVITEYVLEKKLKVYFPIPSLVNHRDDESLHKFNRGAYKNGARYFVGE